MTVQNTSDDFSSTVAEDLALIQRSIRGNSEALKTVLSTLGKVLRHCAATRAEASRASIFSQILIELFARTAPGGWATIADAIAAVKEDMLTAGDLETLHRVAADLGVMTGEGIAHREPLPDLEALLDSLPTDDQDEDGDHA
ncbi:hypothetical protein [Corynebacterium variabile]|uniref:hypothetical protein n=1 Tax=Corynebacterium variabile TaxID=1727 RepID=UPI003FD2BF4F